MRSRHRPLDARDSRGSGAASGEGSGASLPLAVHGGKVEAGNSLLSPGKGGQRVVDRDGSLLLREQDLVESVELTRRLRSQ